MFVLSSAVAVGVYVGVRIVYGPRPSCCSTDPIEHLVVNFTDWRAYLDALGVLNMALWGGWIGWRSRPPFLRRLALVVPIFVIPYLMYGTVREARYYLPVLAVLIPMVLLYLSERMLPARELADVDGWLASTAAPPQRPIPPG